MGELVWGEGTMDSKDYIEILDEYLPANGNFIFLQDGAAVHQPKKSILFLKEIFLKNRRLSGLQSGFKSHRARLG